MPFRRSVLSTRVACGAALVSNFIERGNTI